MKINIVMGPFLPMPPRGCGAVERVWHGVAEQFAEYDNDVNIFCKRESSAKAKEKINGVKYVRCCDFTSTKSIFTNIAKDFFYSLKIISLLPMADILISNTFWLPFLAPRIKPTSGKVVVHVARVPKGQMHLYLKASRIVTVSSYIQSLIVKECSLLISITKVIPNPINTKIFHSLDKQTGCDEKTILYTGRIHPEKGLNLLISAFSEIHRHDKFARLCLIGPWRVQEGGGGQEYLDMLRNQATGMPVEFKEPIYNPNKLAGELRSAYVYCYPSLAEGGEASPLAPLEAMGTGLVPIVSDLKQFRDYIEPGINGLFFDHRGSNSYINLSEIFKKAFSDSDMLSRMSRNAAVKAKEFSNRNIAQMYLNTFEEIMTEGNGRDGKSHSR